MCKHQTDTAAQGLGGFLFDGERNVDAFTLHELRFRSMRGEAQTDLKIPFSREKFEMGKPPPSKSERVAGALGGREDEVPQ